MSFFPLLLLVSVLLPIISICNPLQVSTFGLINSLKNISYFLLRLLRVFRDTRLILYPTSSLDGSIKIVLLKYDLSRRLLSSFTVTPLWFWLLRTLDILVKALWVIFYLILSSTILSNLLTSLRLYLLSTTIKEFKGCLRLEVCLSLSL